MKYITYEEPLKGKCFTERQMHEVYRDMADKAEYPDFECWKTDMLKSIECPSKNDVSFNRMENILQLFLIIITRDTVKDFCLQRM